MNKELRKNLYIQQYSREKRRKSTKVVSKIFYKKVFTMHLVIILLCVMAIQEADAKKPIVNIHVQEGSKVSHIEGGTAEEDKTSVSEEKEEVMDAYNSEKEESKIKSLSKGKKAYEEKKYTTALRLFKQAETECLEVVSEDMQKDVKRVIDLYKAKSLFALGHFTEAENILIMLGIINSEGIALLKKITEFKKLDIKTDEAALNKVLMECPESPSLLTMRINKRILKKEYNLALLDIEKLREIELQEEAADLFLIQCYFLNGKYAHGLSLLKEKKECKSLYEAVHEIAQKYDSIQRYYYKPTEKNYEILRIFIEKDLLLAKMEDLKFSPNIFQYFLLKSLESIVKMGVILNVDTKKVIAYSERFLKERSRPHAPSMQHWADHIKVLLEKNRFSLALDLIKTNLTKDSREYTKIKNIYNEKVKEAREQKKNKEEAMKKKKKEKEELQKKKELEKETARSNRRINFVKSKRGKKIDSEGFYTFLKLKPGSSEEDVMKSYKKISRQENLARRKNQKNKELADKCKAKVIRANKAKDVLMNKIKKKEYDSGYYMTEKEKELWQYNDEMMERYESSGGGNDGGFGDHSEIFEILMNSGGFGGSGFRGFGGSRFGGSRFGGSDRGGSYRVVYRM